ncbi:hypothetical protein [Schaalia suimastitidis]|uniref:hypothetical protein n=1 Tax=Schaalia suimastitidis TaxID=121163 RepID=UPI00040E77FC|nr:hypothetical protein [Schaalia suimastitidis]
MSATAAKLRPASRSEQARGTTKPELRLIERAQPQAGILPIVLGLIAVLVISIVVPMLINTAMAQTSFAIREQQLVLNELNASAWTMQEELQRRSSATALQEAATAQGMVPAGRAGVVTLSTGTVEGGTVQE